MKKITLLTSLLFGLFLSLSINAQTIDFNIGTGLAHNTDFGDDEIIVGNFKFTYSQDTWYGSTEGKDNSMAIEAITSDVSSGQSQYITVESVDGSEFDFRSFWLDVISFDGSENWTLEGFKDGTSIGTQVIAVSGGRSSGGFIQTVTLNSTFDNVDKTIITAGATGYFKDEIFDNFVFGSAVLPCSVPTTQATSMLFGTETSSTLNLTSFTASPGGADGYVIYINEYNYFSAPVNGDEPIGDRSWNGLGQQSVYVGNSTSPNITLSNLDIGTQYFFQIYAYNDCSGIETYETTGLNSSDTTAPGVLTITGITGLNKEYNGTTSANATGSPTLVGVLGGDIVTFGSDSSPVFTFASANIGTGITVITSGYTISGTDAGKYTLTQPTLSADITAKALTISGITISDKVYDDTTVASATGTASLDGKVVGETISLGGSPVFAFASANVGTGITVNTSGYTISGTDSGNYTLTQPTLSGDITAAPLTVTASSSQTKMYGTTDPTLTYSISGFVNGDSEANLDTGVSISRAAGEVVGTYTITPSAAADSNYSVSFITADFSITAAPLTVTASSGQTKVYGATDPTLTYSISGFVNGDTATGLDTGVSISRAAGEVVGAYTITPSAAADSNYSVSFVTADFSITAASLTITGLTGNNKVYDGTTNATASGTPVLSGVVSDDDVVLGGSPVFTFVSAELGTDIQITTTGFIITGADSGNYTLTQPTLSADILTTLGVDDITDVKFSLKLYPNPAINYIRVLGLSEKANYIIYNLLGKKVGKGMVENDEDITIQNLSNGTYFIRIENAKAIKFIKM